MNFLSKYLIFTSAMFCLVAFFVPTYVLAEPPVLSLPIPEIEPTVMPTIIPTPTPTPTIIPTPKPQVKGATVSAISPDQLTPLNQTFRSVFGATPTFSEWKYWAKRYLNDKPSWPAIYGAMQWHLSRGATVGD